jgi:hypothetical protein
MADADFEMFVKEKSDRVDTQFAGLVFAMSLPGFRRAT